VLVTLFPIQASKFSLHRHINFILETFYVDLEFYANLNHISLRTFSLNTFHARVNVCMCVYAVNSSSVVLSRPEAQDVNF
jgi:hypothetical protein